MGYVVAKPAGSDKKPSKKGGEGGTRRKRGGAKTKITPKLAMLARYKPDGGVAWGEVPILFMEMKPRFDRKSAAADQCVFPSHFVFACTVRGLMMTDSWCMSCRLKLAAMCAGAFHVYWAAMKDDAGFAGQDWALDPYLSSPLPAIQVNGSSVAVYYARIKRETEDAPFESTSTLALLIVVSQRAPKDRGPFHRMCPGVGHRNGAALSG